MGESTSHSETLGLFNRWREGEADTEPELLQQIYGELRQVASRYLGRERSGHTLQPTELVNEAFIRLLGSTDSATENRAHFFSLAARAMRRVLVDHSRRVEAAKRPSPGDRITLTPEVVSNAGDGIDVLRLHQALERFSQIAPRAAQVVEMRYFAGLTNQECADALSSSLATVERDWKTARIWLHRELQR